MGGKQLAVDQAEHWERGGEAGSIQLVRRYLDPCLWGQKRVWELTGYLVDIGLTLMKSGLWAGAQWGLCASSLCFKAKYLILREEGSLEGVNLDLKAVS